MDLKQEWASLQSKKCCADCKTTKTPLWRGGPTLCNACGIRYRKKRACSRKREDVAKKQRWKMLGEEEQAAVSLMALSCGSVFA
ncbi:GATA transcription factor 17 [Cajanus cajan]|uniref:GATA transcription factor 17 n=1 Tax=Cajanus cajan TaxID=3821 RepID=UPI00098DCA8D|nr:GATA transcription factor 17 [Cajanus cajan]